MDSTHLGDSTTRDERAVSDLRYDFGFTWSSTYARAARLIASAVTPGLVVDLGAGVGTLAEPLRLFGFDYVGLDGDPASIAAMDERGRPAGLIDLRSPDLVEAVLDALTALGVSDDEPIAAVTMLDVVEHLPDPDIFLGAARDLLEAFGTRRPTEPPLLVVSIPNVAHLDLAAKLLQGRWDVTETGLLDSTHITLFDERRLDGAMAAANLVECGRSDVIQPVTEQRFPLDLPTLGETTLGSFLRDVAHRASPSADTYQFVRAYRCGAASQESIGGEVEIETPFLAVIVRTRGERSSLTDTLTALAAQHDDDFEVLLMVHSADQDVVARVRLLVDGFAPQMADRVHVQSVVGGGRSRPLNDGLALARGRYVAVLDDDDVVTSDWVASYRRAADVVPGRVVRSQCVVQWIEEVSDGITDFAAVSGFESLYPNAFDFLDHVRANRSPAGSYAVPMEAVRTLGLTFDENLRVCEDWKFMLDAIRYVGVTSDDAITFIYRRWRGAGGSATAEDDRVWIEDHRQVIEDLDMTPTLLPAGSLGRIHRLYEYIEQLERELGRRDPDDIPYSP
jgi:SAM-dependent methyltransferase